MRFRENKKDSLLTFYLVAPGEPEHVLAAHGEHVVFDYVPSGHETVPNAVQLGAAVVTLRKGVLIVTAFGRDARFIETATSPSAMQLLFCAAAASCAGPALLGAHHQPP